MGGGTHPGLLPFWDLSRSLSRRRTHTLTRSASSPPHLQALELQANELFAAYRDQYYDSALSSVYLWPRAAAAAEETAAPEPGARDAPFAGCFLIHKGAAGRGGDGGEGSVEEHSSGRWDATHVVSVFPDARAGTTSYELSTTVAVTLSTRSGVDEQEGSVRHDGNVSLAGSLSRSATSVAPTPATAAGHLVALGRMIEDMENRLRTTMDAVYFGKSREVIAHLRKAETQELAVDRRESKQASLLADSLRGVGMGAPGPSGSGAGVKPPPGGIGLPGMMGLGPGFDPKAALANLRATKKAPPPAAE